MMNRETRRAAAKAGISLPPPVQGTDSQGPQMIFAAMMAAQGSDCPCKPCRLLRKAAGGLTDQLLQEVDDDGG